MALIQKTGKKLRVSATVFAVLMGSGLMGTGIGTAHAASSDLPFTENQKGAMEDFVRNFILENPEVLVESVNRMHAKEQQQKEEGAKDALKKNSDYFYKDPSVPEVGNPKGDITVVEFFDYNCGYCKRAFDIVNKAIETDQNIRVRFIEFPILSPQSEVASKWALAANKQHKYWEFHKAMMNSTAPKTEETMTDIAKTVGLDVDQLKKDAASEDITNELNKNREMAASLGLSGTPAFIVGEQILRGYVEYEGFKSIIEDERKKSK
ncbi:MAG: DsbA family protein [Alphaproteobacteria bacterium]|nr:DsbA family protein [Alphaproteobacteria bacterium]MCB9985964.1 DsbA family protein [Micavibrio sp.]HPQ50405.1 DsbA family protein [Alphaproteobacteria bacterium]